MLSLENLQVISRRAEEQRDLLTTEESIKTALVLPFIGALGYDYHNPSEVSTELTADVGTRKHEKVDYAIMLDGKPIILFECKSLAHPLGVGEMSQLTRYFNNTDADIGILTNGVVYKFFSDLDKTNIMDQSPFLEVDISDANEGVVAELRRFAKHSFNPEEMKTAAVEANVIRGVKANLERMYRNPDEEFSRSLLRNVVAGKLTKKLVASHNELVKRAFQEFARDLSGAASGGEFRQEASSSGSQTQISPEHEPGEVIPHNALPVAPTGDWHSLSDIQPKQGDDEPTQMMFPDGSSVSITTWTQAVIQAVQWLTDNYHLNATHCPIQPPRSRNRYIVAVNPIHPSGKEFWRAREVNSLHIELNFTAADTVRNANTIIERTGMDASQFKLRWRAPEQAPAAVIPPSPLPIAPTGGWQSLSDIHPKEGDVNPIQMMFPDNSAVAITAWNQLVIESVRWLTNNGLLDKWHCPIRYLSRYLVATQPIHPTGRDFTYARQVNGLYMELGFNAPRSARNANTIIERVGMDPSQFKLRW